MAATELRSRFVNAGGVRTHYSEAGGNGPVVVLCHGGGAGSSGAAGFGSVMPALAEHFQVYALDSVGGYGETDPFVPATRGIQSRVEHLADFIDALCLDDICIAGNSQGAWVAAKYAIEHPDRVKKLFLVASSTIANAMGIQGEETEGMRALRAYDGTADAMRRLLEALLYDKSVITDDLVNLRNAAATRPGARDAAKTFMEGTIKYTRDPNFKLTFDMTHTLPNLKIPTTFIWGAEDRFAPPELGHQLEKLLPNIPFEYIPKGGHQVQNDQPQVVADRMIKFFQS